MSLIRRSLFLILWLLIADVCDGVVSQDEDGLVLELSDVLAGYKPYWEFRHGVPARATGPGPHKGAYHLNGTIRLVHGVDPGGRLYLRAGGCTFGPWGWAQLPALLAQPGRGAGICGLARSDSGYGVNTYASGYPSGQARIV
jgi:hypothetical protein